MKRLVRSRARILGLVLLTGVLLIAAVVVVTSGPTTSGEVTRTSDGALAVKPAATAAAARSAAPAGSGSAAGAAAPGAPAAQPSDQSAPAITVPDVPKMIIKTGTLSLVVKDVDGGLSQIAAIARQYGGDVLQSNITTSGDVRVADAVIQVRSEQFDAAMADLRGLNGLVVDRKADRITSQDVTEEFVDLEAQINNLKATEAKLLEIQARATRVEDIMAIQREITSIRGQIDRLQGRANYLDKRAAMSTINLHLEPEGAPVRPATDWRFSEALARAWARSLAVFQGVATVLINVAVFALWLLPVALLGWLAWRFLRRRERATPTAPPSAPATPTVTGD